MDRINGANTVAIGGGRRGWRKQNKETGVAGTEMHPDWFNGVQEEILAVIEAAGIAPDALVWHQLRDAILALIAAAVPSVDLSPYLAKAGGALTGGGHISDPVDPTLSDHLVRLGYLNARLAAIPGGSGLPAAAAGWLHNDGSGTLAWTTPTGAYTYGGLGTTIVKSNLGGAVPALDSTTTMSVGGVSGTYKLAYLQQVYWFGTDATTLNYVMVYVRVL